MTQGTRDETMTEGPDVRTDVPDVDRFASEAAFGPGASVGRYTLLSRLGAGAMGVVLAAYDPELDRKVALKLLKPRPGGNQALARVRLQREAQALAKLDHRNVVSVHDVGVHEGQLFVAMEFVAGQTLGAWMKAANGPRPWVEVLRVFADAGQGLAAAHEAGLVHRDFKPDNVMLGADGRVRVMDFGLVRTDAIDASGASESSETVGSDDSLLPGDPSRSSSPSLREQLTVAGALMGTPAYMSLEQLEARGVDHRSDQFSFCLSLYEALYGERAFEALSFSQLITAVSTRRVREPPRGVVVPGWIRKIVLRGLAPDPDERWPSMQALVDALADDPARRRRRWGWAAVTLVGLGLGLRGVAAAWPELPPPPQPCAAMQDKLTGVWDSARRSEIEAAMLATSGPRAMSSSYASDTWTRVAGHVDAYTGAWVAARVEACEATQRGEQSGALLDLRIACLDDRLDHLRATLDELSHPDETAIKSAVEAVLGLPRLERCADASALSSELPPPEDPAIAQQVAALEQQLVEAKAKQRLGRYGEGLALTTAVVAQAQTLAWQPLLARAWLRHGILQSDTGEFEAAELTLTQAYDAALAHEMLPEAAEASVQLIFVVGYSLARHEHGRRWGVDADPLSRAVGTPEIRGLYLNNLGNVALVEGNYEQARQLHQQALALREQTLGTTHPVVASSLNNLANVADLEGNFSEARGYHERALALRERAFGPEHPSVGTTLNNLGNVEKSLRDYELSDQHLQRALAIFERSLGPTHASVSSALGNLGSLASARGQHVQARGYQERALAIRIETLGPAHPSVGRTLSNLAIAAAAMRDFESSLDYYSRALMIFEPALGSEHPYVAHALSGKGTAMFELGKVNEALPVLERALEVEQIVDGEGATLPVARFELARALWDVPAQQGRDRARARSLAELALAELTAAEPSDETSKARETITAWLAQRTG